jgi:hypothetical protein
MIKSSIDKCNSLIISYSPLSYIALIVCGFILLIYTGYSAVISGILGTVLGFSLSVWAKKFDLEKEYIANAKIVLLMLIKQYNEFGNIKKFFDQYKGESNRFIKLPSHLISPSEWRLSKQDLIMIIGDGNNEIVDIMFDIILLDKNFKDLLLAVEDHYRFREPIIQRAQKVDQIILNESEQKELKRYLEAIDGRIEKLSFEKTYVKFHGYLKEKFPKEIFPIPDFQNDKLPK